MLGTLFDREKQASTDVSINVPVRLLERCEEKRERVVNENGDGSALEEEKWKFQAEMLRAECNLLRMEKEIAVKKLERTRSKMERTLRSAVHTLVSVSFTFLFVFQYLIFHSFSFKNCIFRWVVSKFIFCLHWI
jgi:hypothetical protein